MMLFSKYISSYCLLTFFTLGLIFIGTGITRIDWQSVSFSINGDVADEAERRFNDVTPLKNYAKNIWGDIEYRLFREGRDGVLVGDDGWLFTTEEFPQTPGYQARLERRFVFIKETAQKLKRNNIDLVIALIPSKSRIYQQHLGRYRYPKAQQSLYEKILTTLKAEPLHIVDLRPALSNMPNSFLKRDTHWSAEGAMMAAQVISEQVALQGLPKTSFKRVPISAVSHIGDLSRYLPGTHFNETRETLVQYNVQTSQNDITEGALFDTPKIPITLIGTSYSANPLWGFEGHLKYALQTDILNMSDEGLGPFEVMRRWFDSDAFKNHKPRVVIWEMPERYFVMKDPKS